MSRRRRQSRLSDVAELWRYLRRRRSFWLGLLVMTLLILSLILYVLQTAAVAPYMYPLF